MSQPTPSPHDSWIVHVGGDVVEKLAGGSTLSPRETLLYWLWCADYMMRNAGDFENAAVLEKDFQQEIVSNAMSLGLHFTAATFSLAREELQAEYFNRFDAVCAEIRST